MLFLCTCYIYTLIRRASMKSLDLSNWCLQFWCWPIGFVSWPLIVWASVSQLQTKLCGFHYPSWKLDCVGFTIATENTIDLINLIKYEFLFLPDQNGENRNMYFISGKLKWTVELVICCFINLVMVTKLIINSNLLYVKKIGYRVILILIENSNCYIFSQRIWISIKSLKF